MNPYERIRNLTARLDKLVPRFVECGIMGPVQQEQMQKLFDDVEGDGTGAHPQGLFQIEQALKDWGV